MTLMINGVHIERNWISERGVHGSSGRRAVCDRRAAELRERSGGAQVIYTRCSTVRRTIQVSTVQSAN